MESLAFPADGWGVASTLTALFDTDAATREGEDRVATKSHNDWYSNADIFRLAEFLIPRETPSWMYSTVPLRDVLIGTMTPLALFLQTFTAQAGPRTSSPESYNQTRADELYHWSKSAVAQYL